MNGLLDFRYKQPYSRARERYLLTFLEKEEMKEVSGVKSVVDMIFATIVPKVDTVQPAVEELKRYIQLALPSNEPAGNIESVDKMDKDTLKAIKDRLVKKKKEE